LSPNDNRLIAASLTTSRNRPAIVTAVNGSETAGAATQRLQARRSQLQQAPTLSEMINKQSKIGTEPSWQPASTMVQRPAAQFTRVVPNAAASHNAPQIGRQGMADKDWLVLNKPNTGFSQTDSLIQQQAQISTVPDLPAALIEHKQRDNKDEFAESPSMDMLRTPRQADPENTQEVDSQPSESAELTKEQINELIKQLPQFDVNQIVNKVTRELEKRMRFERQRRGM
jgi:hypothetical protein